MEKMKVKFWSGPGGAVLCDQEIEGIQKLDLDTARYYGGPFIVCETALHTMAKRIAEALDGEYVEKIN